MRFCERLLDKRRRSKRISSRFSGHTRSDAIILSRMPKLGQVEGVGCSIPPIARLLATESAAKKISPDVQCERRGSCEQQKKPSGAGPAGLSGKIPPIY